MFRPVSLARHTRQSAMLLLQQCSHSIHSVQSRKLVCNAMLRQCHQSKCVQQQQFEYLLCLADVFSKFEKSAWGQKLSARVSKATTTDFQRYQWSIAKTKKSQAVKKELKKLQKSES